MKAHTQKAAIITILALAGLPALAQTSRNCGPREVVHDRLASEWGESRQTVGLDGAGSMVEMYASDETGTWSIVVTSPQGTSCIISAGQAFGIVTGNPLSKGDPV